MSQVPEYVKYHWGMQIGAILRNGEIPKHNETILAAWPKVPVGWLTDNNKNLFHIRKGFRAVSKKVLSLDQLQQTKLIEVREDEILKSSRL